MAPMVVMIDDVDLSKPEANRLDYLFWLKGKYPQFKCNLFVIPMRSTWEWIQELNRIPWIEVCMHGWNHNKEESITKGMITEWQNHGLPSIYKGPEWKLSTDEIVILLDKGFYPCTKKLKEKYSNYHIWNPSDLEAIRKLLESGVQCNKLSETI